MNNDEVWDMFLGEGHGALFRSSVMTLLLIPRDRFEEGLRLIDRELMLGPMLDPSAYLDGRRFDNAREYRRVIEAAGAFRAALGTVVGKGADDAGT